MGIEDALMGKPRRRSLASGLCGVRERVIPALAGGVRPARHPSAEASFYWGKRCAPELRSVPLAAGGGSGWSSRPKDGQRTMPLLDLRRLLGRLLASAGH